MTRAVVEPWRGQTVLEEVFNSVTCGAGLLFGVAALAVLAVRAGFGGDAWRVVSACVYGASLVMLFLFSTLYHSIPSGKAKRVFEVLDHCMIYVLIAGTYTPFALVTLRGPWGWSLFGVVWGLALFGILFKTLFISRFRVFSALVYLLMGWLAVVVLRPLTRHLAPAGIGWLLAGGVIYSAGLLFYSWKKLPFHHTIWHLFVLAGCFCHFLAVFFYVVPR